MRRRDALPDPETARALRELDAAIAAEPAADPDLALLVADVRTARDEPSAAFLASLDARVHAGFPRQQREPGTPPWHRRLRAPQILLPGLGLAAAAALVIVIASGGATRESGLSSSLGSPSSSDSGSVASAPAAPAPTAAAKSTESASSSGSAGSAADSAAVAPQARDRKVQRAAELTLTPKPADVQETSDGVIRETQAAGGYVQESNIATRDGGGGASFTLRIPSARLDATLARLSKLAHVGSLVQSSSDITSAFDSAASQLSDARATRAALLRALGKATTDRQIASLRARLADNRSEIAQRAAALDAQRRRADLATVAVTVEGTRPVAKTDDGGGAWTPRDALHDAGRILQVIGGVLLIALAVLAPLALLAALALLAGRTLRRHRREGALDTGP